MRLHILHRTIYDYRAPVALMPHRMFLRPRGSHTLTPVSATVAVDPVADIEWTQDVFGNLIATASFTRPAQRLTITSRVVVDQNAAAWPVFRIAPHAHHYPFAYSADEQVDLGALLRPAHDDPDGSVDRWARGQVAGARTDTLALLQDLNAATQAAAAYVPRDAEGTQSPATTLALATGSCRDLTMLFIDAARRLGFGARAVSGYLLDPDGGDAQHGATHAWAEIYLPCAGWIAFDPTNGRMGEAHLVPVAVARDIARISPIDGRYLGDADAFLGMTVEVAVTVAGPADQPPQSKDDLWKPG